MKLENILTTRIYDEDLCLKCGSRNLEWVDDPDCTASGYSRKFICKSCGEVHDFYGEVVWTELETEIDKELKQDGEVYAGGMGHDKVTVTTQMRNNALKRAREISTHIGLWCMELESFIESHSDLREDGCYESITNDNHEFMDERTFLRALELWSRVSEPNSPSTVKEYEMRTGKYAEGETWERAKNLHDFYRRTAYGYPDGKDTHPLRKRGEAWCPDIMQAHCELAKHLGAAIPMELFINYLWYYTANEMTLDENWTDCEERMETLRRHVLPVARFILDRETEWAWNRLHVYPPKTKAERVADHTKEITRIVNNIVEELDKFYEGQRWDTSDFKKKKKSGPNQNEGAWNK